MLVLYLTSYINELLCLLSFGKQCFPLVYQVSLPSLDDPGLKLRDPSPLSCWSLCSCCYFKICLTETPLVTEVFNQLNTLLAELLLSFLGRSKETLFAGQY